MQEEFFLCQAVLTKSFYYDKMLYSVFLKKTLISPIGQGGQK